MKMSVEGFDDVDANLESLVDLTDPDVLRDLGEDALQPVAAAARGIARVGTGQLRDSIAVGHQLNPAQAAANPPEPGTVETYVGPGPMPQAITEEFGTVHEQGHPYLRPAWDANVDLVAQRLAAGVRERLARILGR